MCLSWQFKSVFSVAAPSPCLCTAEFNPTCSSDGTVASNPCLATKCGTQEALFSCDIDFGNPDISYDDEIQECEEQCLEQVSGQGGKGEEEKKSLSVDRLIRPTDRR